MNTQQKSVVPGSASVANPLTEIVGFSLRNNARRYSDEIRPLSQLVSLVLEPEINPTEWRELLTLANDRLDSFLSVVSDLGIHEKSPTLCTTVARFVDDVTGCLGAFNSICSEAEKRGDIALSDRVALIPDTPGCPLLSALRLILSGDTPTLLERFRALESALSAELANLHDLSWLAVCSIHDRKQNANTFPAFQIISDSIVLCNGVRLGVIKSAFAYRSKCLGGLYGI